MSDIVLSSGVRQNLLSLQKTADLMSTTQNRLATGKKVNSALDNPTNFFTSAALQSRAGDLNALLDSMSVGIKTLQAADNGISAITKTIESMQSTLRQARQDKSFQTASYTIDAAAAIAGVTSNATAKTVSFSGGSVGTTPVAVDLATAQGRLTSASNYANLDITEAGDNVQFDVALNGGATTHVTIEDGTAANSIKITVGTTVTDNLAVAAQATVTGAEMSAHLTTAFAAAGVNIAATGATGSPLVFTATTAGATGASTAEVAVSNVTVANGGGGTALAAANFGFAAAGTESFVNLTAKTVDTLVQSINATTSLTGKVTASNDGGKLRIQNLSTSSLTVTGIGTDGEVDGTTGTASIGGNDVRKSLVTQFNDLKDQLDKFADDASFNGINLLRGDKLKLTFNETGTSTISIQAKTAAGAATSIDSAYLGVATLANSDVDSDTNIDALAAELTTALNTVRSQASTFGSSLSTVQNRQDFTKAMINTLQTGADNLVLADSNEEAANMLALQTRQQLSSTALSLASQADQAVLRLFG
jgi:flagellin